MFKSPSLPLHDDPASACLPPVRTLARLAYQQLRRDIVYGRLQAGSKLKLEVLVRTYEVGMSPLREALMRLVGDQLVRSEDQRGFWVASLSLAELDDILRVRGLVEGEALRLSIEHGDAAWEAGLRQAYEQLAQVEHRLASGMPQPVALAASYPLADRRFHAALVAGCRSPALIRLQDQLYHQTERYRYGCVQPPAQYPFAPEQHRALYEAAIGRDSQRTCQLNGQRLVQACAAARAHLLQRPGGHGRAPGARAHVPA
jgi:GntR family carbon starvation induced transcriptional regulator